ncbi:hypothetical protein BG011_006921 [Mortierella polycephala]|uniref:Metallo-dependent hydrolase n=1 Tax=Mortierella polycephala TaxID=41804 RepID=A0A9P6TYX4_9FUNG|nr:hypothetical protein BG011_006921 [Mortierella polycephala]
MCGSGRHGIEQDSTTTTTPGDGTTPTLELPQHLYAQLTDAHCHIQDDRDNIQKLVHSWESAEIKDIHGADTATAKVAPLLAGKVCLMGVQPSQDIGLTPCETEQGSDEYSAENAMVANYASLSLTSSSVRSSSIPVVTVTWNDMDAKGDWDLVSRLAHDHPDRFVPCFGIHPWFSHKYKPLEGSDGNALGIRGAGTGGTRSNPGAPENTSASPSLSFSSSFVTPISGEGVRHEDFLSMSKQLQEQMAKESRDQEGSHNEAQNEGGCQGSVQLHPSTTTGMCQDSSAIVPIEVSTHTQHQHDRNLNFAHYQKVLNVPNSAPKTYLAELSKRLPLPRSLEPALKELRRKLEEHPHALLGEIGLDRIARIPEPSIPPAGDSSTPILLDANAGGNDTGTKDEQQKKNTMALTSIQHQLDIVREQLKLAASLDRAVSFHCVQAYGHWHDFLILEGKRLRQMEADKEFQMHVQQIQASGGTPSLSPASPLGVRLSKRSAARLRKEARDAAWEAHVASTLQESSDEEDESGNDDNNEQEDTQSALKDLDTKDDIANLITSTPTIAVTPSPEALIPTLPPFEPVLPPRLCMHSYGGSVDMLKAFTKMDHPPEIFFSFSILINGRLQERKLKELIMAVPEDRLLIESDHHSHAQVDLLLVEMVHKVAGIRQWTLEETVEKTTRNWHRFVYG